MVQTGAEAREVFLLASGSALVTVKLASGAWKRLGVFSPGMALGEMEILDQPLASTISPTRRCSRVRPPAICVFNPSHLASIQASKATRPLALTWMATR